MKKRARPALSKKIVQEENWRRDVWKSGEKKRMSRITVSQNKKKREMRGKKGRKERGKESLLVTSILPRDEVKMELSLSATDITSGTRQPPSLCHLLRGSIGLFFSETSPVTDRENTPFCRFVTTFPAIFQNVFSLFPLFIGNYPSSRIVHEINIGHLLCIWSSIRIIFSY